MRCDTAQTIYCIYLYEHKAWPLGKILKCLAYNVWAVSTGGFSLYIYCRVPFGYGLTPMIATISACILVKFGLSWYTIARSMFKNYLPHGKLVVTR